MTLKVISTVGNLSDVFSDISLVEHLRQRGFLLFGCLVGLR